VAVTGWWRPRGRCWVGTATPRAVPTYTWLRRRKRGLALEVVVCTAGGTATLSGGAVPFQQRAGVTRMGTAAVTTTP
jgi:hypothetical protein